MSKTKISYEELVKAIEALGWTIDEIEEEQTRQFVGMLMSQPDTFYDPSLIIHDEDGDEPPELTEDPE